LRIVFIDSRNISESRSSLIQRNIPARLLLEIPWQIFDDFPSNIMQRERESGRNKRPRTVYSVSLRSTP